MVKFRSSRSYFLRRSTAPGALRVTVLVMLMTVVIAGCAAILLVPVYRVSGCSMEPTLHEGDLVLLDRGSEPAQGDICCFFRNGKVYVKRVIALGGSTVDLDGEGNVSVDNRRIGEQYIASPAVGTVEREFPCFVPEKCCFVMGDNRARSLDSRSETVGFVPRAEIIGRVTRIIHMHGQPY